MTQTLSDLMNEMKPLFAGYIVRIGYSEDQGERFAEAYMNNLQTLPTTMEKIYALINMHTDCMYIGFESAGIDAKDADERAKAYINED